MGQIGRTDEQHVHLVERGDVGGRREGAARLDLDDADDALVDHPRDIGMGDRAQVGAAGA